MMDALGKIQPRSGTWCLVADDAVVAQQWGLPYALVGMTLDQVNALGWHHLDQLVQSFTETFLQQGFFDTVTGKTWPAHEYARSTLGLGGANAGIANLANATDTFSLIASDDSVVSMPASQAFNLFSEQVFGWAASVLQTAAALKVSGRAGQPSNYAGTPPDFRQGFPVGSNAGQS